MGKTYSWPNFKWWQFIQKRRWRKVLSRLSAGERIKFRTKHMTKPVFTDDFTISGWIAPTQPNKGGKEK